MNATAPLIITPHPVTLEGQRTLAAELQEGERLGAFLSRTVPDYDGDLWEVRINGVLVPLEVMDRVRPKGGTVIEVRGVVKKTALMIVALVALTVFTMGVGTAMVAAGYGAVAAGMAQAAIYAAGALIINKVLGPKRPKPSASDAGAVYSLGAARNQPRPYEPVGLLLGGPLRITPDVASNPYSWYESDDQYMAMVLTPGINVGRVEALYNGDALLSSFEGVTVWHNGFSQMPAEEIPLYSNADTIAGGALEAEKGEPSPWVQRTSSASTIRLKVDVDFMLFDTTSKGKPKDNRETIEVQYRVAGASNWMFFGSYQVVSRSQKQQRRSYSLDVHEGQYEVRVRIAGRNTNGSGATSDFTWSTLTSIQKDTADYAGLARIGIRIKATGQLNGQPDEIRCVAHSNPVQVWTEAGWVTQETNNPGALILAYARGFRDENGKLIAGVGLEDPQIDIEALKGFMLSCAAEGYTYAHHIKDVRNHDDVLNAVALAGFGQITWAGGRLSVAWAGAEQPLSGVVNMATIKKGQFQVDYTLANAADGIEYSYFDATDWTTKTLRVAAPGVSTMLNPATVQGEGITSEAHAARMARYHLAQSLYQYKDISYSTDIEHLSYRRLSVLALQHDLTQWGFGGRLVGVLVDGEAPYRDVPVQKVRMVDGRPEQFIGVERVAADPTGKTITLQLDEPVPAPAAGNAYIGLRIPGERVYRVFRVQPFTGTSDTLRLIEAWPAAAPLPGAAAANPAHDTIWIYDFKQTPGYRVRVTGIEPESDLKGAKVSVVPEPPEFWDYVLTGQYVPPVDSNPGLTRPVASGLNVTEQQVVQGDTVFTELTVTFEISGPVGNVIVLAAGNDGILTEVAQTSTRTATWRIRQADQYTVVVRPFSPAGRMGVSASATYATAGADVPPRLVDYFEVDELPGGVRMYTWGFLSETIQSPDFAGVEVRYMLGQVSVPDWEAMTPIGEAGYHTVPFEAVVPKAGDWTFACRSRNTSGDLSTGMRVVAKALGQNLGEQLRETWEEAERANQRVGQAITDMLAGDLKAANDAIAAARQYTDEEVGRLNSLLSEIMDAPDWEWETDYPIGFYVKSGGKLYAARQTPNVNLTPHDHPEHWTLIGEFASVADAFAAVISAALQNASDISAQSQRIDAVLARMPAGDERAAGVAQVASQVDALVEQDRILGQRLETTSASLADKASNARVDSVEKASIDSARVNAEAIQTVEAASRPNPNLLANPGFDLGTDGWSLPAGAYVNRDNTFGSYMVLPPTAGGTAASQALQLPFNTGVYTLSADIYVNSPTGTKRIDIAARDASGNILASDTALADNAKGGQFQRVEVRVAVPPGSATIAVRAIVEGTDANNSFRRFKLEYGGTATAYTDEQTLRGTAAATSLLRAELDAQGNALSQAITQVRAEQVGSPNLVPNSIFAGVGGWTRFANTTGLNVTTDSSNGNIGDGNVYTPGNTTSLLLRVLGRPAVNTFLQVANSEFIAVRQGERLLLSAWINCFRCIARVIIYAYNGNGALVATASADQASTFVGSATFNNLPRPVASYVVNDAAIAYVRAGIELVSTGEDNPYVWYIRPLLEKVPAGKTLPSAWSEGAAGLDAKYGAVTQSLSVRATQLENGQTQLMAKAGVMLDVNKRVIGWSANNDGERGTFDVVADRFAITDPNNTGSTTFEQGRWITRSGGYMLAHGKPFGTTGDLMMWLGIGSDPAAASKANAMFWIDNRGNGYFGGSLRAGAINSGGQYNLNESNWNSATFMSATHKGSLGRPKTVMRWARLSSGIISGGNSPQPARTGILRLRLWRGPTLLSEQNITATSQNVYTADDNTTRTYTTWEWPQLSLTDTSSEAGDIPYRMQIDVVGGNYYGTPGQAIGVEANLAVLSIVES
ncbi:host specificity factor TipJ family phage tail protein [Stenotrophomonas sp. C3(2023)]|uniref:host specificity factor TipJ family phage tail protein n=1 Tax=Stenotrophomonas sp. C3(2023) TaxID=3080277 RepID=UPI00293CEAB6|nr:host specificity factor TipJ family phage tail protein [Stenotrophomonas sp. C3(2023)]MDV3469000.1 host specificity factor TipJ family phage tail protein [Stenotrophomonas sp. C3(2023)]